MILQQRPRGRYLCQISPERPLLLHLVIYIWVGPYFSTQSVDYSSLAEAAVDISKALVRNAGRLSTCYTYWPDIYLAAVGVTEDL